MLADVEDKLLAHLRQQRPWDEWFREYIPSLARVPNSSQECVCRSPVPGVDDQTPSASVNISTGLWHCFRTNKGGNFVDLWVMYNTSERDSKGYPVIDHDWGVFSLALLYGLLTPIDEEWLRGCQARLKQEREYRTNLFQVKPWNIEVIETLGLGYDPSTDALVIPIYLKTGELLNCRLYSPGREPKMRWLRDSCSANIPFPVKAWERGPAAIEAVVLVEGEPDAISLRAHKINAVSGTGGAGNPVPEGRWFWGRPVYIIMDADTSGQKALQRAVPIIRRYASAVAIVTLPEWPNRPNNADISDYLMYLRDVRNLDENARRDMIFGLFADAQVLPASEFALDDPPIEVSFSQALSSEYLNRRVEFAARVSARSEKVYTQMTEYSLTCPHGIHTYCTKCPMHIQHKGHLQYRQDPRLPLTLSMIKNNEKQRMDVIKRHHGVIHACPDVDLHVIDATDVSPLVLAAAASDVTSDSGPGDNRHWREALSMLDGARVKENSDYMFSGLVYALPQTQQLIFMLDRAQPISPVNTSQDFTEQQFELLAETFHGSNVQAQLLAGAAELEARSKIVGRKDLHMFYRCVWHSALAFELGGKLTKGWLDAIVVGDTRCGKSATFDALTALYQIGYRCDTKHQTTAGLLGSVIISQSTGERFVIAGLLPRHDMGVIGFDEYQAERVGLIDSLSIVRAEGLVKITKTASAEFPARVRMLWLANPGMGLMMQDLSGPGINLLTKLVSQPEDIARFDMAMMVGSHEIDSINLTRGVILPPPKISVELHRLLLSWVYSRQVNQIKFTDSALEELGRVTTDLIHKYDASIPLVEPADQRARVARLAVSIAGQCFSTPDGHELMIGREHMIAAEWLLNMWYDKPLMGYDVYSAKRKTQRTLRDEQALKQLWEELLGKNSLAVAELMLSLDELTERIVKNSCPILPQLATNLLQELSLQRAIKPAKRGRGDSYTMTPAFVKWLQEYVKITTGERDERDPGRSTETVRAPEKARSLRVPLRTDT